MKWIYKVLLELGGAILAGGLVWLITGLISKLTIKDAGLAAGAIGALLAPIFIIVGPIIGIIVVTFLLKEKPNIAGMFLGLILIIIYFFAGFNFIFKSDTTLYISAFGIILVLVLGNNVRKDKKDTEK